MTGVFPPVLTENKKFSIVSCRNLDSPYWGKAITAAGTARYLFLPVCAVMLLSPNTTMANETFLEKCTHLHEDSCQKRLCLIVPCVPSYR